MLTSLLSNETTTFDGKYYQLKDARNEPKGPQQPHPPICIGGSGEKRTLPHHREIRRPLELRRRHAGGVRPQARRAGRPLRGHRPRPEGDHAVGARSAGARTATMRKAVEDGGALGKEGLDLAIIYLPPPHDPAVLEPLAEAIRDSGSQQQRSSDDQREYNGSAKNRSRDGVTP